ncbi:MAG: hypothetical protein RL701_1297 [Pseudomonadota bacterium]
MSLAHIRLTFVTAVIAGCLVATHAAAQVAVPPKTFVTAGAWACAIDTQREVECWVLEQSDFWPKPAITSSAPAFEKVPSLSNIVALDAAHNYLCSLDTRGAVQCWGCIWSQNCRLWPKPIALSRKALQIAVSDGGACALLDGGAVQCWGMSSGSRLFPTDTRELSVTESPVDVPLAGPAVQLTASSKTRCVLDKQGYVTCWGEVCGDEDTMDARFQPRRIAKLDHVSAIAANASFTCAVAGAKRELTCWGLHDVGQTSVDANATPAKHSECTVETLSPKTLHDIKQLALSEMSGMVLTDTGSVYHWGDYHYGGIRHMGQTVKDGILAQFEWSLRPTFKPEPEVRVRRRYNQAPQRVAEAFEVRALLTSGDYACLELVSGARHCEWLLRNTPFHLEQVWPQVQFDSGQPVLR